MVAPEDSETGETEIVFEAHSGEDGVVPVEHAGDATAEHDAEEGAEGSAAYRRVEIPVIVAPLVVDGDLVNYAFVSVELEIAPGHDAWEAREQTAYLRDAMLRAAHERPLNLPGDPAALDMETASRVWTAAATDVLGEGVVGSLHIVSSDVRYPQLAGGR